jgi:hypothetical protein
MEVKGSICQREHEEPHRGIMWGIVPNDYPHMFAQEALHGSNTKGSEILCTTSG